MNFKYIDAPIPHIVVENFYTEKQVADIWKELEFLSNERTLLPAEQTAAALDENLQIKKQNNGLFLDAFYLNKRKSSHILEYNRNIWDKELISKIIESNDMFRTLPLCNQDSCLLSYYENGNYYKPHYDNAVYTMLVHFFKEPKMFSGGELTLFNTKGDKIVYENMNNRMIFFPSFYFHSVDTISLDGEKFSTNGRYTISQFFGINLFGNP